jgi:predicted nucleic acid-binding Zn ribbon protein
LTRKPEARVRYLELEQEERRLERERTSLRPLSETVKKLLKKYAPSHSSDAVDGIQGVRKLWRQVVGVEISQHTLPVRWKEGVLTVNVDSNPLATELKSFGERAIIENLREQGLDNVHTIHFRNGSSDLNS